MLKEESLSTRLIDNQGVQCFGNRQPCLFGDGDKYIHLLGDSHLGSISPSFVDQLADKYSVSILQSGECLPALNVQKFRAGSSNLIDENCDLNYQMQRYNFIKKHPGLVIVLARYPVYFSNGVFFNNMEGGVERDIYRPMISTRGKSITKEFESFMVTLSKIPGVSVAILNSVPEVGFNVPRAAWERWLRGHNSLLTTSAEVFADRNSRTEFVLSNLNSSQNISIIDLHPLFCDHQFPKRCAVEFPVNNLFYQDDDHLNSTGAGMVTKHVIDLLSLLTND